ncbi:gamma-glutamyl-gamma-aminobutyrate hydrolase family protein [Lacticaseibacillus thailandensis]|uniref:Glutamine amidotransferase n=1 Tax=Lacticaseibacillus thailandensis DSM 22698 = JCM 13996 TaxID=1423810 RepID=A0A0R2CFJ4_9LACO|nr:gamma-glutamyl-gamma-aminobutyrate hydrolase family protein [Lacticaseibacillus thailandensis]KRM86758.1 glutamine amidotransferase [Lacticaseibacillus thailandensis DSM 22698 = JCM 13996]
MTKPIIAMTADALADTNPRMPDDYPAFAPHDIKEAVFKAGGIPTILPFPDNPELADAAATDMVPLFDGLILPGGPDVDPTTFGEEPMWNLGDTYYPKDRFELALIKATLAAGKPILGICRGIQILNVALGGDVYQDTHTQDPDSYIRHPQVAPPHYPTHHVDITPDSRLHALLGDRAFVNSRHHQAVRKVGTGLTVTATAPDGVIEALESTADDLVLAVQWHPENMWQHHPEQFGFFSDIVARAQAHKHA